LGSDINLDADGRAIGMGYAAIYIPEFPTLAWLRLERTARDQAVAVIEGKAPLEHVVSFNRAGKELGLRHSMSKVQAETSGQILFHLRALPEEKAALEVLFEAVEHFSPRVQIIASPVNGYANGKQLAAVLLVDQSGTETLFGDARSYAEAMRKALQELEFPANVAVAPNAEASLLLARSYSGVTQVDDQHVTAKLAPLPLSMLAVDATILPTLERWGIRNLGELAALPEAALISRIGQQGKRLQRLATGREDHLLVPQDPSFVLSEQVELDGPLESLEPLLFVLSPMLETILRQAINHAYALRSVTITLTLEKAAPHRLEVRPAVPVQSKDLLLKLLNLKLQSDPPQAGILGVTLDAEPAIPQVAQRGLFQAQFPEPDKLDLLIARLQAIVGEDNVGSPALSNSFCDDEFVMVPFQPSAGGKAPLEPIAPRPALRRFRPAQQAKVAYRDAVPSILFWKGERLELGPVSGPWQSSGYWWDGRRWTADEWDAVVSQPPQALRLRHEPEPGNWYVAGQYD
jgi:protein ImuB